MMIRPSVIMVLIVCIPLLPVTPAEGVRYTREQWYITQWCRNHGGEIVTSPQSPFSCDCLTSTHAVKFSLAAEWAEILAPALYCGIQTKKKPGIVLIVESEAERVYFLLLNSVIHHYGLDIETRAVGAGAY